MSEKTVELIPDSLLDTVVQGHTPENGSNSLSLQNPPQLQAGFDLSCFGSTDINSDSSNNVIGEKDKDIILAGRYVSRTYPGRNGGYGMMNIKRTIHHSAFITHHSYIGIISDKSSTGPDPSGLNSMFGRRPVEPARGCVSRTCPGRSIGSRELGVESRENILFSTHSFLSFLLTLLLFTTAFAAGITAAAAATPAGAIISNTAQLDYMYAGTSVSNTSVSNAAETIVAQADTEAPEFLYATVTPNSVTNGRVQVQFSVGLFDTTGVDTVSADLSMLGYNILYLEDNGIAPDTTAGDSVWNAITYIDSDVMGDTYSIPIIAADVFGYTDTEYVQLVVSDTSPSLSTIRSLGWNLADNVHIFGNAITLSVDYADSFTSVRFEYRNRTSSEWKLCDTGEWSENNPDVNGSKWGIFWDITNLADDSYLVRAIVKDKNGIEDPSPNYLRVIKDSIDSWIHEYNDTAQGVHIRRHRFLKNSDDTTVVVEGTSLMVPNTALSGYDTVWIKITVFINGASAEAPAPSAGSGLIVQGKGTYRRFEREDGNTYFGDNVILAMPYDTSGLTVDEDNLAIYRFDKTLNTWIKEDGCIVDKDKKLIWLTIRHFTDFAVFGVAPAADLSNVLIYPNPYIPYDNDPQTGQPFVRGDNTTGIVFRNLPATVSIDIYTIGGRRVSTIYSTNTGGNLQWDVRADDGTEAASGLYFAIIKTPDGSKTVKKFMVIR